MPVTVSLAGMTDDPAIREPFLKMAREWMEVARAEQQQKQLGIFTRSRNLSTAAPGRQVAPLTKIALGRPDAKNTPKMPNKTGGVMQPRFGPPFPLGGE
jgi:hypothetical protein